jgi:ribulose bisphosphate carboxylase small subunit
MYLITKFPNEETNKDEKINEIKRTTFEELTEEDVLSRYEQHLNQGYAVGIKFSDASKSAKDLASGFAVRGVDYTVTLKLKTKGPYEVIKNLALLFESRDFDYVLSANLKVNSESTININRPDSWTNSIDGVYEIKPKVKVNSYAEIQGLIDDLDQNPSITYELVTTPKKAKEASQLLAQLQVYGDDVNVTFTLKDAV